MLYFLSLYVSPSFSISLCLHSFLSLSLYPSLSLSLSLSRPPHPPFPPASSATQRAHVFSALRICRAVHAQTPTHLISISLLSLSPRFLFASPHRSLRPPFSISLHMTDRLGRASARKMPAMANPLLRARASGTASSPFQRARRCAVEPAANRRAHNFAASSSAHALVSTTERRPALGKIRQKRALWRSESQTQHR